MTPDLSAACEQAIHVICGDGRILRAGQAVLYILSGLGWRRSAALFSLRPNIWLVEIAYQVVATNRAFFDRLMFRR